VSLGAADSRIPVRSGLTKRALSATSRRVKSNGGPACPGVPCGLAFETWDPCNLSRRAVDRSQLETPLSPLSSRLPRPAVGAANSVGRVEREKTKLPTPATKALGGPFKPSFGLSGRPHPTLLSLGAKPTCPGAPWRDLQFPPVPDNQRPKTASRKPNCHPDRSEAERRDLLFLSISNRILNGKSHSPPVLEGEAKGSALPRKLKFRP
jgi:hypothetical protein